jgi:hypothetical protein
LKFVGVIEMNRTVCISVYLSPSEVEQLSILARRRNLKLSTFMRRELTRTAHLSRDTAILAGEIARVGELVKRGFEKAGVDMKEVAAAVGAIDARVFIAQLPGVSVGE